MSQIEINQLNFAYPGQEKQLFKDVTLNLDSDWKLGLFGRNGRGKTTLLKLLLGKYEYNGTISHQVNFTYFPCEINDPDQLAYYALSEENDFETWRLERELNLMGVEPELLWRPFASLSGGEQTKLKLALVFIDEQNFPLIDEPTNHLDMASRQQIAAYLKKKKQGFIIVSHDRDFVDQVSDHILVIEKAQLSLYSGNYSTYRQEKELSDNYELQENAKLKKDIHRLKQTMTEKKKWSLAREGDKYGDPHKKGSGSIGDTGAIGARAARVMKKSKSLEHRMEGEIADKQKLLKNIEQIDPLAINFRPSHHQTAVRLEDLNLSYDDQQLFLPVNLELKRGQCVGLVGPNGIGKTSLVQALNGTFAGQITGRVQLFKQGQISYIKQDFDKNTGTLSEFAEKQQLDYEMFLNNLHKLGLERTVFKQRIEDMSMGQQKRVEVAKSLSQPAELYIWDEPLNYLDIYNQDQLSQLLLEFKPTVLLIEHDRKFIDQVTDQIVSLTRE